MEVKILSVNMICRVCPEGQKLTAAVIHYEKEILGSGLKPEAYQVRGRGITRVYAAGKEAEGKPEEAGMYVVVELSVDDAAAELTYFDKPGPDGKWMRRPAELSVRQVLPIACADGSTADAWTQEKRGEKEIEPMVELFTQHVYHSGRTGRDLPYNLYLPRGYDDRGSYPLVMFIHDKGPLSEDAKTTLRQGIGALVWAEPEFQKRHPCIVLAPQFAKVPVGDGQPDMLETTFDLCEDIMKRYSADPRRVYATGQSMGCMSSIAMGIRRPDFFTAYLLVAGQWDADAMAVLSGAKMAIIVSRGDPRAFAGMNASLEKMKEHGARIQYAAWDQDDGVVPESQAAELFGRDGNIYYAVLKTEKRDFSCHMDTWKVAYGVSPAKEWLLSQVKGHLPVNSNVYSGGE